MINQEPRTTVHTTYVGHVVFADGGTATTQPVFTIEDAEDALRLILQIYAENDPRPVAESGVFARTVTTAFVPV